VKILEGLIVFVVLASALSVAILFMRCVDAPTRFATPKERKGHQE
jgi:hypothetical protein